MIQLIPANITSSKQSFVRHKRDNFQLSSLEFIVIHILYTARAYKEL